MSETNNNVEKNARSSVWYKEFWPWFLILLLGSVVIASFVTLYLAIQHADRPIDKSAYNKSALAIALPVKAQARAQELGLAAEFNVFSGQLRLSLHSSTNYKPSKLLLHFAHPFNPKYDFDLYLQRTAEQSYLSALPDTMSGRWNLLLIDPEDSWQLGASVAHIESLLTGGTIVLDMSNE